MKTELQPVTPALARKWLQKNIDNRPLRPSVVQGFHAAYNRGEWKATHQGVAFSRSGRLLDGQHRLTFISQLPEGSSIPINVSVECEDDLFGAIDQGARRSASDVLGISEGLSAVAKLFAKLMNGSNNTGLTIQFLAPFVEWVKPEFQELTTFSPTKAAIWSSAPVRAAAVFQIKQGCDADFVKVAYHSLVTTDIDSMPYAARVLMQQRLSGKIVSARSLDLFCRALRAFNSHRQEKIKTILITDQAGMLEKVRAFIAADIKKDPGAMPGSMVAKPVIDFRSQRLA